MHPHRLSGPVLACDLDGTLVRVNTFPLFVRWVLVRLLVQRDLLALVRLLVAIGRRKVFRGSHLRFKADVHRAGQRVDAAAVQTWARSLLAARVNSAVLDMVRTWQGPTVLVTAAPSVYADIVGAEVGFTLVQASDYCDGGYVENVHEAKVERLRTVLTDDLQCGISDDALLDGPLLRLAAQPFHVDATGAVSTYVPPDDSPLTDTLRLP